MAHIQSAVCNHVVSKSLPVKHGAPQGSVLGPGLFDFNACDYSTQAYHTQLVGMATDNKLRCDQHTDIMCKTGSKHVFPLSKVHYLHFHTKNSSSIPTLNPTCLFTAMTVTRTSLVGGGCSNVLKKGLN